MQITAGDSLGLRMTGLAESFPALRGATGVSPWDADKFIRWALRGGISHGEEMAALFVLMVWNNLDWGGKFNLAEAISVWDSGNYRAFREWANHPWWA